MKVNVTLKCKTMREICLNRVGKHSNLNVHAVVDRVTDFSIVM